MMSHLCWLQQGIDDHNKDDEDDEPDLFHRLEVWAESTVAAEDLLVNNRSNRQAEKIYIIFFSQDFFLSET